MTILGISGKVRTEKIVIHAKEAFKDHQMKEIGPGHWHLARPNTRQFCCDIVVMCGVGLAVWGDIDGCFFSYYSGAKSPKQLVYWMGGRELDSYVSEKARIGMTDGHELVSEYDEEVAIYDFRQELRDAEERFGCEWDEIGESYAEAVEEAITSIKNGENIPQVQMEFADAISDFDTDVWEWLGGIGRVESYRLIYAHAALQRLCELFRKEDKIVSRKKSSLAITTDVPPSRITAEEDKEEGEGEEEDV